ncbi:MAG: OmpA family protein, partial [Gammaproteobacteria bacterium]|nr:OmpA family protein [Gammaproteobacteria bacterium]
SGSISWLFVIGLGLLVFIRRIQLRAAAMLVLAGVSLNIAAVYDVRADSLCGHYTEQGSDKHYYVGNDPERDDAGFANCWYGAIGPGYSYVSPDEDAQNFFHDTSENHDSGFHLFIGRQLSPHWFAELKYADLGEAGITNRNPAIAAAFPSAAITYNVPSLMVGYQWRVTEKWKPFAKAGISAISNSSKGGPIPFEEQTSMQLVFGMGLKYDFGKRPWFVRGDIDWYDRDAWYAGVSAGLFFGGEPDDRPRVAPRVVTDSDGDGVTDDVDQCPDTPATAIINGVGCPIPIDSDADGVLDHEDDCPDTRPGTLVDSRGCDADADDDGIRNSDDQCPNTAAGAAVDIRGCEITDEIQLQGVEFETNSDRLRPNAARIIEDAARTLDKNRTLVVEVAGHTDDRGDAAYNRGLSERRAKTVRDYLINTGIAEDRLTWRGYGEEQPIADNTTVEGREKNRRVVLRILRR